MTPKFDSLASEYVEEAEFLKGLKRGAQIGALGGLGMLAKDVTDRYPNPPPETAIEQPAGYDPLGEPKGLDLDAPQHQQYFTSAITGEPSPQPEAAATHDPGFIKYMKSVENSIKSGWKNNKWYPHKSAEGGNKTIAYGHKLKAGEDFSKGITDTQALQLLTKDLDTSI